MTSIEIVLLVVLAVIVLVLIFILAAFSAMMGMFAKGVNEVAKGFGAPDMLEKPKKKKCWFFHKWGPTKYLSINAYKKECVDCGEIQYKAR